jgi:hypothetical protein
MNRYLTRVAGLAVGRIVAGSSALVSILDLASICSVFTAINVPTELKDEDL